MFFKKIFNEEKYMVTANTQNKIWNAHLGGAREIDCASLGEEAAELTNLGDAALLEEEASSSALQFAMKTWEKKKSIQILFQ